MAGGYATRLRPLSYALPKLLFPVGGTPLLEQTIEHLASFGVDEVILAVNYLADQLKQHFGDNYHGVAIRYSLETIPLGTGGPIALARPYLEKSETFLVMNGDILSDIDISAMQRLHRSKGALATIALHEVSDPTRFGVARLDEDLRIREFVEKPKLSEAPSRLVNAGVYLMEPPVIDRIASGRKVIIEREVFPFLAKEGSLLGYVHSGTWFDIGNIADYVKANFALLDSKSKGVIIRGEDANIAASAKLTGPLYIGDHTTIEGNVKLGPQTIIGSNVKVGASATIRGSVIFDHVVIGGSSLIEKAVIGNSVLIGREVVVGEGSVVAGHVSIRDRVRLAHNVYVHPHKEINEDILKPGHVV